MRQAKPSSQNRSEELRQRRTQRSTQRVATATHRATSPAPSRPVVVRNTTYNTAPRRQVPVSNPRRQYYIALDTPGTELRLPALPTFHPSWRMLSFALAVAALGAAFTMLFSPFFKVGTLSVQGPRSPDPVGRRIGGGPAELFHRRGQQRGH